MASDVVWIRERPSAGIHYKHYQTGLVHVSHNQPWSYSCASPVELVSTMVRSTSWYRLQQCVLFFSLRGVRIHYVLLWTPNALLSPNAKYSITTSLVSQSLCRGLDFSPVPWNPQPCGLKSNSVFWNPISNPHFILLTWTRQARR